MGAAFFYPRTQIATRQRQAQFIRTLMVDLGAQLSYSVNNSGKVPALSLFFQDKEMRYDP